MKEIVLDTETTGLSVKEGHRIVEIGCIELDNLIPTKNYFHCYLNPGRKVSEKALEVHGYTNKFLGDKKKFREIVDDFLLFIKDKKLIIHNADFDLSHLNNELSLIGEKKIDRHIKNINLMVDTRAMFSADISIKKNTDSEKFSHKDIQSLLQEAKNIIQTNYLDKISLNGIGPFWVSPSLVKL